MYKPISGNEEYKINKGGVVVDCNNRVCLLPMLEDKVGIHLYGVLRHVYLDWLSPYAFYETRLPEHLKHRINDIWFNEEIVIKDKIVKDRMYFSQPFYYNDEFRIVPNYTDYAVSIDGRVIKVSAGELCSQHTGDNVYRRITVWAKDISSDKDLTVHRLLALA
jgi:hypothetical protein